MKNILIFVLLLAIGGLFGSQYLTLYVVAPIGALPEGSTVLLKRTGALNFIDSPDALCKRTQGNVTLLCRASALAFLREENIIARLPYSRDLYLWSTDNQDYSGPSEPALLPPVPPVQGGPHTDILRRLNRQ